MSLRSSHSALGIGLIAAGSFGLAASASAAPLLYNVAPGSSNVGLNVEAVGLIDATPDFTELIPGGNDFPATALMVGQSNTAPTGASTATADVGLPGNFDNGANGITFTQLSIVVQNAPGEIAGFGIVPVPLDLTGSSIQPILFTARMSQFSIILDSPFSSSLTPTVNPNEWLWAGVADVTLSGILEPRVEIPGEPVVTLGAFPFEQQAAVPLAGTFAGIPTGTEINVGIGMDALQNQALDVPPISEQLNLLDLGLGLPSVTLTFELDTFVLTDLTSSVVYRNATPIPEPNTALLLGLGLAGVAAHRRR